MERSFLSKVKAECGTAYTSKMEGMFKDMEMSRDIMSSYAAYASGATNAALASGKAVDMEVQVLTTGYWPVYPKYPNIILPSELLSQRDRFESYYNEKYQGRRIAWQYSLGNCIVKASFPKEKAPKELNVNVCQTLVLLCFQYEDGPDGRGLKLDDIMKKTGIDDRAELERVLQSLSLGRDGTRVLKKIDYDSDEAPVANASDSPKKKQKIRRNIGEHDRFLFNSSFTNNQRRIRITNITMKETVKERTKTHEAVSNDRLYLIDAAVVRIMKARKTLDHRALMGEVMTQLKFPASASDIKKRIETLIEREYMERIEGDRSKYKYLA
jgi:cullin-4